MLAKSLSPLYLYKMATTLVILFWIEFVLVNGPKECGGTIFLSKNRFSNLGLWLCPFSLGSRFTCFSFPAFLLCVMFLVIFQPLQKCHDCSLAFEPFIPVRRDS